MQRKKPSNPDSGSNTMEAGHQHMPTPAFQALQQLGAGLGSGLPELAAAISHCIDIKTSALLDRASPRLEEARLNRRENKRRLQEEMDSWAQNLNQQGACESRQVCFPLIASCQPWSEEGWRCLCPALCQPCGSAKRWSETCFEMHLVLPSEMSCSRPHIMF